MSIFFSSSPSSASLGYVELGGLPRPEPLSLDPRIRWRHMYDGTLQGQTLSSSATAAASASGSSSLNNSTNSSNNLLEGLDSSESGSESDLDLQNLASIRGPLRFVYPRRHSPRRLRWGPLDQRRLGGSPHASRFVFINFLETKIFFFLFTHLLNVS